MSISIAFGNGKKLEDLKEISGGFVFDGILDKSFFENGLSNVKITYDDSSIEYPFMKLVFFETPNNESTRFVLQPYSQYEIYYEKLSTQLEYFSMMSGIDI